MFDVDRMPYLAQRSDKPVGQLAEARLRLFSRPLQHVNNVPYAILNMFARHDPCRPHVVPRRSPAIVLHPLHIDDLERADGAGLVADKPRRLHRVAARIAAEGADA